jgi:hypothetical protein
MTPPDDIILDHSRVLILTAEGAEGAEKFTMEQGTLEIP